MGSNQNMASHELQLLQPDSEMASENGKCSNSSSNQSHLAIAL
jgi:hypothetical protein